MRQLLLDIWRRGSHVIIYGMIPSGILTWQSKFCLQTRKYTLQQVNFPWIVLDCWSVQMLVFSVCFCSGRGKERCAFFSICVTIAIAIPGGFGNFRRFTFGFLYQTWGFDPFHNRFVGKKMWGSPTQKRFRKKKKNSTWTFGHLHLYEVIQCQTHPQIWLDLTCHDDKAVKKNVHKIRE